MIRRKEDVRIRTVKEAQGGKGEVYFHDWLLPEEAPGHGRVFSTLVIPPGASIGFHEHHGDFEAFYVMEGVATVTDGEQVTELYPGDMTLCPEGAGHGTENRGDQDLVLMALIMNVLD
ncbi:MAG: cupin domain-containing protein [Eubacteriales bacterium]|nr:cupin domain-containing protein [Eubacteriales bacterium]